MAKLTKISKYSTNDLVRMAKEYLDINSKVKKLNDTKKMLSDKIKEATLELGVKDDKGSHFYENEEVMTGRVAKKSVSLNEEKTFALLKEKGIYDEVVEEVVVQKINEDALESKVMDGTISNEEFEGICDVKVSYSVSVKEKEEMPAVETTKVLKAASKK